LQLNNPQMLPDGYAEYILCTRVYHCTPLELRAVDNETAQRDLAFYNAEQQNAEIQREAAANKK
jgi:hypothetical protein